MRIVIQRVNQAKVSVHEEPIAAIDRGLLVLLGIEELDTEEDASWLLNKVLKMRIFEDEHGKMNKSVVDINGTLLVVSQFTLHASTKKGNRPSFIKAAKPDKAEVLYNYFIKQCQKQVHTQTGRFGATMQVSLVNDGPVTIIMDTKNRE